MPDTTAALGEANKAAMDDFSVRDPPASTSDMGVPVSLSIPLHLEEKGSGTCTHRRRICNGEHAMLNNSTSRRRVCLALNEHSGKAAPPAHHIDFAGSGFACPARQ